ncbi:integral membrane protein [Streptococcus pneumoniae]|nr:integral membrane protein [Streptococcus pneumoniae]
MNALKIANLVLGIIAIVYYKGDNRVGAAPSVLMIVFGGVSLIPFLGWVGGILVIIGGSLFLATLKKFKSEE